MHVNASLLLLPMPFEMPPNDNCNVFSSEEKRKTTTTFKSKECGNKMKIDLSEV